MYNNSDELVFKLNAVESTCAVEFYTVVDTSRSPVHNIPCPLHWVRDTLPILNYIRYQNDFSGASPAPKARARGAPLLKKYGNPSMRENLVL